MQKMLDLLEEQSFEKDAQDLAKFYEFLIDCVRMDLKPNVKTKEPTVGTAQEREQDIRREEKARELLEHDKQELAKKEAQMRILITDTENRRRENEEKRKAKIKQESEAVAARNDLSPEVKHTILEVVNREGTELSEITKRNYEKRMAALQSQLEAASMHSANDQGGAANPEREVLHTSQELMADVRKETSSSNEQVSADTPPLQQAA